jgi:trk system potassium uptake protein TrkH
MFINIQPISNVLGALIVFTGLIMLICLPFSLYFEDGVHWAFVESAVTTIFLGGLAWWYEFQASVNLRKREGYLIVVLAWLGVSAICTLPFIFSGSIPSFTNAFFESVSGFTTTGATILTDIEIVPKSILLWRSITQWLGGMGIIVLTVALFPLLGIAGIELFVAEAPGPTSDKIHPRIKDTARTLWLIYFGLTLSLGLLLWIEGMTVFDAVNHAMTCMATGGFSTKNASIAYFDNAAIQYTLAFFMVLAGMNYTILFYALRGRLKKVLMNEEWRMYMIILVLLFIICPIILHNSIDISWERAFRDVIFNAVSIVTTTGFVSADYTMWGPALFMIFFVLLFTGACAGSTSGGIKLVRHLVFMRNGILEFKRLLHPRALIRLKLNRELIQPRILTHILVFLLLYLFLFTLGSISLAAIGIDFETAIGAAATCLGNVGPGIGTVGPVNNFAHLPDLAKHILSFLMICGRLELFTVLILFTPFFWRDN